MAIPALSIRAEPKDSYKLPPIPTKSQRGHPAAKRPALIPATGPVRQRETDRRTAGTARALPQPRSGASMEVSVAHSSSGPGRRPLKAEITGSSPVCATTPRAELLSNGIESAHSGLFGRVAVAPPAGNLASDSGGMIARMPAAAPINIPAACRVPSFVVLSIDALLRSERTTTQLPKD